MTVPVTPTEADPFVGLTVSQQATRIMTWLSLFHGSQDTFEIRVLGANGKPRFTKAGWFAGPSLAAAKAALDESNAGAEGVYFTLNPVRTELAKRWRGIQPAKRSHLAEDADAIARRWLLIDIDPERPAKVSSTDEEKAKAIATAREVVDHLAGRGWPVPLVADSGNGLHLYYRVDHPKPERLPLGDDDPLRLILHCLAGKFADGVTIDTSVYNPSRICKLPGTVARKGEATPERPHRRAVILETL